MGIFWLMLAGYRAGRSLPICLPESKDGAMAKLDIGAVLKRAMALAEQDGFVWELISRSVIPGAKIDPRRVVTDERRHQYMALAREELAKEIDNA